MLQVEVMSISHDMVEKYGIKKIKGPDALELLSSKQDDIKSIVTKTIKYGSNAKIEELDMTEMLQLVAEINKFNGITKDFQEGLEEKIKS